MLYGIQSPLTNAFIIKQNTYAVLPPNIPMISDNGRYSFIFQNNGDLVLYDQFTAVWNSNTCNNIPRPNRCIMQSDGNLVLYHNNTPIWTHNKISDINQAPYTYIIQSDGNFVIYDKHGSVVWITD
jgi:hypothetical protein